jgi:hypothetical protein
MHIVDLSFDHVSAEVKLSSAACCVLCLLCGLVSPSHKYATDLVHNISPRSLCVAEANRRRRTLYSPRSLGREGKIATTAQEFLSLTQDPDNDAELNY